MKSRRYDAEKESQKTIESIKMSLVFATVTVGLLLVLGVGLMTGHFEVWEELPSEVYRINVDGVIHATDGNTTVEAEFNYIEREGYVW